jgi:hypothetical protein
MSDSYVGQKHGDMVRCANPHCRSRHALQDKHIREKLDDDAYDRVGFFAEKKWFAAQYCILPDYFNHRSKKTDFYRKRFYCGPACHLQIYHPSELVSRTTQKNLWFNYLNWFDEHPQAKAKWFSAFKTQFLDRFPGFQIPASPRSARIEAKNPVVTAMAAEQSYPERLPGQNWGDDDSD